MLSGAGSRLVPIYTWRFTMPWKTVRLVIMLIIVLSLTACHAVNETDSQISLAKPAADILAQAQAKVHEVIPSVSLPLAHSYSRHAFSAMPKYWLQTNNPAYLASFAHPDAGCNWLGVTGQVFDPAGNPVEGINVVVSGTLNGVAVNTTGITGTSKIYGPGAFEIVLGTQPVDSQGALAAQLVDANGKPISVTVPINTYKDCQKNLTLVNFLEVDNPYQYAFPIISSSSLTAAP
jgi:hypothetical protein